MIPFYLIFYKVSSEFDLGRNFLWTDCLVGQPSPEAHTNPTNALVSFCSHCKYNNKTITSISMFPGIFLFCRMSFGLKWSGNTPTRVTGRRQCYKHDWHQVIGNKDSHLIPPWLADYLPLVVISRNWIQLTKRPIVSEDLQTLSSSTSLVMSSFWIVLPRSFAGAITHWGSQMKW